MYRMHTEVYEFARFFTPLPSLYTFLLPVSTLCFVPLLAPSSQIPGAWGWLLPEVPAPLLLTKLPL